VFGAVGVLLVALILPYFQKWLVQRSQIEAARASVSQSQREVSSLQEQLDQWKDDQYVKAQARQRLHFVMPGETGFVVLPGSDGSAPKAPVAQSVTVPSGNRPWYADVWVSAEVAGAADRAP
jgi:Septum formation initiator